MVDYTKDRGELLKSADRYFAALRVGKVRFPEYITLPLEQAHKAHEMTQDRNNKAIPVLIP